MSTLRAIAEAHRGRIIHKWTHYFDAYERHLARFRDQDVVFVEIGVGQGGSLEMWRAWLGPHARIIGIDIDPARAAFAGPHAEVRIASQTDPFVWSDILNAYGRIDVVIDDGSHRMDDLWTTFGMIYSQLPSTGVYIAEDLHTCYRPEFGGGLRTSRSFLERTKGLIDWLNAYHLPEGSDENATNFARTTASLHFYDSMLVLEKTARGRPEARKYGGEPGEPAP